MEFFPEFQANYKLKYSHLKRVCKYASLIKILDNHYAESAHKLFALSQLGIISSIQEQITDKEWTTTTNTYTPVTNSQGASRVSSQLGMALSNPATFININMSYPSGKFNWSPDRIPFEHEIEQQINSFFPSKMTSTGMEKNIINSLEELKRKQQTQQDQVSIMVENQNSIFSEIRCCKHLLEEKLDKLEKGHSEFKMHVQKSLEEKDNLIKSFLCNKFHEQDRDYEVKQSSNDDNLDSGHILANEDNCGHVSNTNSTEQSIQVNADDLPAVPINSFVSFANGPNQVPFESISSKSELLFSDLLNDSGPDSSLLKILDSSYSSMHQFELSNDSSSNVALSSSLSINSDDIHHKFNVNEYDDSKTCPREASRKAILSTNVDANEPMDLGHGHNQIFLSSSSIFKLGNPILNLPNDDSKVSHAPDDDMFQLATPLFSGDEALSSTLIDADLDFVPDTLSCLDDNDVVQNESNEQVIASQHKQIVSSAFPFEELNKTISESLEIEYDKTNNDQNEELPVFNEDCLDVNDQLTILPTNSNERRSSSPIAADPHSSDIPDGFNDDDIMPSTSIKPRTDSQHCQNILPIKESITSPTGGTASSVSNYQEPLPNIDDSIVKLNDASNEHQASNKNRLSSIQSCVNICSPAISNFIVKFQGAHHKDSVMLNTPIERKVIDDTEHNQGVQASSSIIQDSFFVYNDSLDSPVLMKINGNDQQGKLYVDALIANPSINENESRLSSISNANEDSVIFIEEVKDVKEVRMTDEFVQSPLPFKCSQGCNKMLNTANELKDHLKTDHKLDPCLCSVLNCKASFEDAHLLQKHIDKRHPKKSQKYPCLKCAELFDSKWDFDEHSKGCNGLIDICEHEINIMLCRVCTSEATNNKNGQKNKSQRISNKKPKAKCKQSKSSARIASRTNVRLTAHYNFQCTFGNCDSKFVQRGRLINHINVKHFGLVKKASERNENVDLRDPCIYIREISLNEKD